MVGRIWTACQLVALCVLSCTVYVKEDHVAHVGCGREPPTVILSIAMLAIEAF